MPQRGSMWEDMLRRPSWGMLLIQFGAATSLFCFGIALLALPFAASEQVIDIARKGRGSAVCSYYPDCSSFLSGMSRVIAGAVIHILLSLLQMFLLLSVFLFSDTLSQWGALLNPLLLCVPAALFLASIPLVYDLSYRPNSRGNPLDFDTYMILVALFIADTLYSVVCLGWVAVSFLGCCAPQHPARERHASLFKVFSRSEGGLDADRGRGAGLRSRGGAGRGGKGRVLEGDTVHPPTEGDTTLLPPPPPRQPAMAENGWQLSEADLEVVE